MRRDLGLLRKIVLAVEDAPGGWAPQNLAVEGHSEAEVGYYSYLIVEAGLAHGQDNSYIGSEAPSALITNLTWAGHEFAEAARMDTTWNKAMTAVKEKGGAITVGVLNTLLVSYMKHGFGIA